MSGIFYLFIFLPVELKGGKKNQPWMTTILIIIINMWFSLPSKIYYVMKFWFEFNFKNIIEMLDLLSFSFGKWFLILHSMQLGHLLIAVPVGFNPCFKSTATEWCSDALVLQSTTVLSHPHLNTLLKQIGFQNFSLLATTSDNTIALPSATIW